MPGWKSSLDLIWILLSLPIWLPLMLLLMLLTRIASPGPVFYRQKRVGLGGRHFFIWKFRTMKLSAETQTHERYFQELMRSDCPMTKLDAHGDPRLAPFGRILRASGLDELPQIFNVLCGEMSLVGPRPCLPNEFANYEPWQRERMNGLPGLTGYWQVNGKNKTTFNEMIAMDLFYLKNMSIFSTSKSCSRPSPSSLNNCSNPGRRGNAIVRSETLARPKHRSGKVKAVVHRHASFARLMGIISKNMKKPITVGVLGCGYWGPLLVRNFKGLPHCRLKAVCDPDIARVKHVCALYSDLEGIS